MRIRRIRGEDAEAFLHLQRQLDEETSFMMLEPGERTESAEATAQRICDVVARENHTILLAEVEDHLVGFIEAVGGRWRRNRHSVYLVVGILEAYTGKGIGTRLFEEVEAWAAEKGLHRLELTVMTRNERALALYRKRGFEIEGVKKDSLWVDGEFVDEYYIAKRLG